MIAAIRPDTIKLASGCDEGWYLLAGSTRQQSA
jgi:hypothetical protein